MKNIAQIILLTAVLINCNKKETKSEFSVQKAFIDINDLKHLEVGSSENFESVPVLNFVEITENEYNNLKIEANFITDFPVKKRNHNYLLNVKNKTLQLKEMTPTVKEGEKQYHYLGFYPTLNMYAFSENSLSDNLGFSELNLINTSNSFFYSIISPGDDKVENPVVSPMTKYLVYHYNYIYDQNKSFIGILKIGSDKKTLTEYRSYSSSNFKVIDTAWFGDDHIGIKVTNDDLETFRYYKASLQVSGHKHFSSIDGNYSISVETEPTTTGMASISYSFKISGNEVILETSTYHEPITCNGKYVLKEHNKIFQIYYNDAEEHCKSDSAKFSIKKEKEKYYIKGVGGEGTIKEWMELHRE
ncbi:hypothetical protein [Chryseobacterium hagamense]|uniref:Uncharacterized protein n=1 Tax=Chryseobacterium hagamense TaxID=395935 RepID=A0A511YGT5_9FLAO|nr:hypothetical protein [Chryseobacterium hagamense]GEN74424.1 hypothetical protein CHA01nite_01640 [Chryseobacterium hagamense]